MLEWFDNPIGDPFIPFGENHLAVLLIYTVGLSLILLFRSKLSTNSSLANTIRWILFVILVLSEATYQIWALKNGAWSSAEFIPLHLCGIASIITAIALVNKNKKLIQAVYFVGFVPALIALITPELIYDYPHFRFWKFFIHHMTLSWASIFLVITNPVKITWKSTLEVYAYLLGYAAIVGFFINPALDSNYLFLARATSASTPLNMLGDGVWYYINLCLLALALFIVLWWVHRFFTKRKNV